MGVKKDGFISPSTDQLRLEWAGAVLAGSYGSEGAAGSDPEQNDLGSY